jgi:Cys-tRNA(Pro)/Cys-tRNA(Cys) deacylase
MSMSEKDLELYLKDKGVNARIIIFDKPTTTVSEAENVLGISRERIIKSMVFIDDKGSPILAIVTGDKKIDMKKLAKECEVKEVRLANPIEVKKFTGYEVGATPPFGFKNPIKTIIDPKVFKFDKVYGGGGAMNALLEINTKDLLKLTNGKIANISK